MIEVIVAWTVSCLVMVMRVCIIIFIIIQCLIRGHDYVDNLDNDLYYFNGLDDHNVFFNDF